MRRSLLALVVLAAGPQPARGQAATGQVTGVVTVKRPAGVEPGPVLVYLVGFSEPPPDQTLVIRQHDKRFEPSLVAVTAGQSVSFPNGDPFLHNVFSPTPARRFDLGSYKTHETRVIPFPSPAAVDVFCNIHPQMSATILVLPNRRFAFTDAAGRFAISGVPPGRWTLFAYSRRAIKPVSTAVDVSADQAVNVALTLAEEDRKLEHKNKYGEKYRDPARYR